MYRLDDIKSVHLEITTKCQARCPMCPRRIQGGPLNPSLKLEEITLELFKTWFDEKFIKQLTKLYICGNLGDPIIAKDTLEIFEYIRTFNPTIELSMHTNGSARDLNWWRKLAELKVYVIFGIDGLQDTHHLYRIATDWDKIIENAKTFISSGGIAKWHMLVFEHNEHQVNDCEKLSDKLGFKEFTIKHTSRFRDNKLQVLDDYSNVLYSIKPTNKSRNITSQLKDIRSFENNKIHCKVKQSQEIYVSASGNVSPCCWLDLEWASNNQQNRIDYIEKVGYFPNLYKMSLEDIFLSGFFNKIEQTWNNNSLRECSKQCGKFDKLNMQFETKEV